ncbi:FMN-dependent NADH-azoreductase [Plantibacter sp. Mn2098]|uniref:FMN-dependent NADH-azoreductase n=1 Tax=Plantibacter sp. Mn2098 TaxID=3395266 RepID=UPI003BBA823B
MATLLHLDSSADLLTSRSRALTAAFADAWAAADPTHSIVYRDLHVDPVPHLADASLHWTAADRIPGANPPAEAEALQRRLLDQLLAADVLLIGAPLYNFSVPSTLKTWIDHIHVPGVTSSLPELPLAGRPAVVVTSRGGAYDAGTPTADWDHEIPALRIILGDMLGMDVRFITTSVTLAEPLGGPAEDVERSRSEFAAALAAAGAAGAELGSASA